MCRFSGELSRFFEAYSSAEFGKLSSLCASKGSLEASKKESCVRV